MPPGRPVTTGTGHRGERVAVSSATAAALDAMARAGESRPAILARVVAEAQERRRRWAARDQALTLLAAQAADLDPGAEPDGDDCDSGAACDPSDPVHDLPW